MTTKAMLLLQKHACKTYLAMLSPKVYTACISTSAKPIIKLTLSLLTVAKTKICEKSYI